MRLIHQHPYPSCRIAREPIVDLVSGTAIAEEILCREDPFPDDASAWRSFYRRLFACDQETADGVVTAFNLDTRHVLDQEIWQGTERFLGERDARRWAIEWTEHDSGDHLQAAKKLRSLHRRTGVGISIDDVGAGFDGHARLSAVSRAQWIKIDGGLFQAARTDGPSRAVVQGICDMAKDIGARSVIEWIETKEDLELARNLAADCGQGYLFTFAAAKMMGLRNRASRV